MLNHALTITLVNLFVSLGVSGAIKAYITSKAEVAKNALDALEASKTAEKELNIFNAASLTIFAYSILDLILFDVLLSVKTRASSITISIDVAIVLVLISLLIAHLNSKRHHVKKDRSHVSDRTSANVGRGIALGTAIFAVVILISAPVGWLVSF